MKRFLLLMIFGIGMGLMGWGQVNISVGNTYSQSFTIGTSATANLPTGWKVDAQSAARTLGTYSGAANATAQTAGANMSGSATSGIYNYGAGTDNTGTDRAVGGLSASSSNRSINVYADFLNNGGGSITSLTISYNVEKYRTGTNAAGYFIQMYYSTNGTAWTSAGTDFYTSFAADGTTAGYATTPGVTTSISSKTLTTTINASSHLYLAWQYSVISGTSGSSAQALGIDDVSITANGPSSSSDIIANTSFTYSTDIAYGSYQGTTLTDANSIEVAQFDIRDGGSAFDDTDALSTILTAISFNVSNSGSLRRVALFDGSNNLSEVAGGATASFSSLTITAADDASKTFSIRVSFLSSATDNQQFSFTVNSATASGSGSGFAAGNAGGAVTSTTGDNNRIEVTASDIIFDQNVSTIALGAVMSPSPTIRAWDANSNFDLDYAAGWTVAVTTGTATFDGTATTTGNFSSGIATLDDLIFNATGTGNKITVTSGSYTDVSNPFDVTDPQPEINIKENSTNYLTGSTYAFGDRLSGTSSSAITFTVENLGTATLNLDGTPDIVAKSGTNASEFTINQSATSTTVSPSGNTTFTITFSPTSQGSKTAQISIANDDATGSENPYLINLTGTGTVSSASDIANTSGYSYTSNVEYASYQTASTLTTGNSVGVNGLTIRDGAGAADTDNLGTTLTAISFTTGGSTAIRTAALFDGTNNVAEVPVIGATTITFTGLTLSATDNGTKDFELRVTFQSTVTDNQQIAFTVSSATASSTGSGFTAGNAGGAASSVTGDINRIEVIVAALVFGVNPSNVTINAVMSPSPTVVAKDGNANVDLDFEGSVTLNSTGTISGSATNPVTAISGTATFSNLIFSAIGTGITVAGSSGSLTATGNSNSFNVSVQAAGTLLFEEDFSYTSGTNLTANGWSAHSSSGSEPITVNGSGLSYLDYGSSNIGNAALLDQTGEDVNRTFTPQQNAGSTIYYSFLINVTACPTAGYVIHLGPTSIGIEFRGRVWVRNSSGNLNFGIAGSSATPNYSSNNYSFGTTYLIVVKYAFDATNSNASIYINPSVYSEPSIADAIHSETSIANTNIGSIALRQFNSSQNLVIDGIRVGTNWGAVLGNPQYDATSQINSGNYNTVSVYGSSTLTTSGSVVVNKTLSSESSTTVSIPASNSLTIGSACQASISGTLTNSAGNSGLVIKSDATGTGSLKHSSADVPSTVERYITGASEAWHLLSSPVASQAISGDFIPSGTYEDGTGYDFYTWYEPASTWVNFKNTTVAPTWNTANGSTSFVVGRGYMVAYQAANPTKTFTGNLSQGTINIPLSYSGTGIYQYSNLVGNPYPSSIDWKAATGWTRSFVVENAGGYDMHIWNQAESNYGAYNSASISNDGTNGATRYIAPMQGFSVKASGAGNLTMTDDVRVHSSQAFLKSTEELADYLKLTVTGSENTYSDQAIIEFNHVTGEGGASKMFSFVAEAPSLYTTKEDSYYSIDFRGAAAGATVIPLNFKAGVDGNYVITASDLETFAGGVIINIEDVKTGQIQNLMEYPVYTFVASKDDESARFKLHFGGTFEVSELQGVDNIRIYSFENSVYFTTLSPQDATISIFNITGQEVYSTRTRLDVMKQIGLNVPTGWYVVKVMCDEGIKSEKIFIR